MVIRCPNCKGVFNDDKSHQDHLPCRAMAYGGEADLQKSDSQGSVGGENDLQKSG